MATPVKNAITTPAISTTGLKQRTVSDTIRHLFPGNPIMGFVSSGAVKGVEDVAKENFRIGKAMVSNTLYENYTYTPLAISTTIATYSSASSFTLTDYNDVTEGMILVDTTNRTACRVSALSTATVTATSIGSTAFSSAAGRTVLILPSTYKENSTSPYVLMKDEDNLYNVLQINRQAWEISASAEKVPYYGSPAYWKRIKQRGLVEYLRKKEAAFLFNERAASGETTTDATLGNFRTTRGIWQWGVAGGTSDDVGGAFTYDYITQTLATKFHSSVGANTKKIGLCGTTSYGIILGQFQDKATITLDASKEYKDVTMGAKVTRITTAKGDIDIMLHDLFDKTGLDDTMLIFNPDRIEYVHMPDRDDKVKLNIQGNDQDGYKDEVLSEWGVRVEDGGASILILTNLW